MSNFDKEFRRQNLTRGTDDVLSRQAHGVVIVNTNSQTEELTYAGGRPGSRMTVTHPYIAPNSWIRVMPERGTKAMVQNRAEDGEPFISAYLRENNAKKNTASTEENRFYYRSLREGEIDITSPGIAAAFFSRRGTLRLRGGVSTITLDSAIGELSTRSPTHTISFLSSSRSVDLTNQIRVGVVTRPGNLNSNKALAEPTIQQYIKTVPAGTFYAKEYLLNITSEGPVAGVTLIDHRVGDVYDDSGKPIKNNITGKAHRSRTQYGTQIPGSVTEYSVDVEGNVTLVIPAVATKGAQLNIDGFADLKIQIGRDIIQTIKRNVMIEIMKDMVSKAQNHTFESKKNHHIVSDDTYVESNTVELVKNADQWMVRGDDFLAFFNQHNHPTPTGPSGPPIKPATPPDFLSKNAKLK